MCLVMFCCSLISSSFLYSPPPGAASQGSGGSAPRNQVVVISYFSVSLLIFLLCFLRHIISVIFTSLNYGSVSVLQADSLDSLHWSIPEYGEPSKRGGKVDGTPMR